MPEHNKILSIFEELLESWHGSTEQLIINMSGDVEQELDELQREKEKYKKKFINTLNS